MAYISRHVRYELQWAKTEAEAETIFEEQAPHADPSRRAEIWQTCRTLRELRRWRHWLNKRPTSRTELAVTAAEAAKLLGVDARDVHIDDI